MTAFAARIACVLVSLALAACSALPPDRAGAELGPDGVACVGTAPTAVAQMQAVADAGLVAQARAPSGKGGVCAAQSFVALAPVTVYRVYDAGKGSSSYGRWWSLDRPVGPRDAYRAAYGICTEWSALDRLLVCDLKPGSAVVLGTTQSVDCATRVYDKTAALQLYIPNDQKSGALYVDNCREEGAWP